MAENRVDWKIYRSESAPHDDIELLGDPPPWREFKEEKNRKERGRTFRPGKHEVAMVNAALHLRRPLFVTGGPGTGKSSLAEAVAQQLKLGQVLHWAISSRSTLQGGLYHYDALARLRDIQAEQSTAEGQLRKGSVAAQTPPESRVEDADMERRRRLEEARDRIGRYVTLNELGTALVPHPDLPPDQCARPRVLLIDEIDKSDIDLPNDLLHVFEEGEFEIPELVRIADLYPEVPVLLKSRGPHDEGRYTVVKNGKVRCDVFPFVVLTSNGEREMSPAFLRRCLRLDIEEPDEDRLEEIVKAHLEDIDSEILKEILERFCKLREAGTLATDQLLNALFLITRERAPEAAEREKVLEIILRELGS